MATPPQFTPPPTRIISWQQEVLYADPAWNQGYNNPWIYEFSNGRLFYTLGPGGSGAGLPYNN